MPDDIAVLLAIDIPPTSLAKLRDRYTVHQATTPEARAAVARERGDEIRAILTNGTTVLDAELIAQLPQLGIICAQGVGHEGIDLAAARAHGIIVTNGPGTNAECVADHAIMLVLASLRDLIRNDALVRAGGWRQGGTMRPRASGKRLGILGMGDIGSRIARRAEAFGMTVAYHNRRERTGAPWPYVASAVDLAEKSDVLVCVVPGGTGSRHLIGAAVLEALGPGGFLVNVGRGSVVDTEALVAALREGRIAGAALDVYEGEPVVPLALRELSNVTLTPHMAGRSPESTAAVIELVLANLEAHFAGRPVLTPVSLTGA